MSAGSTNFHVLLEQPLVAVISSGIDLVPGIRVALKYAAGRNCQLVVQPAWHFPRQAREILQVVQSVRAASRKVQFTFLCPTYEDALFLREHGLDGLHVHTNAFIDHRIFRPVAVRKQLRAAHVANTEAFKRHRLAWNVEDIGVVTYDPRQSGDFSELLGYRKLGFANFRLVDGQCRFARRLSPSEVATVVSASRCGLILSAVEGQNNASTEYLLCGVPVISTPSIGGRDAFFDPAHSTIVEPDPRAIEAAVERYQTDSPDPFQVRESVMRKIRAHRKRFLGWLSAVSDRDLLAQADEDAWIPEFTDKLKKRVEV